MRGFESPLLRHVGASVACSDVFYVEYPYITKEDLTMDMKFDVKEKVEEIAAKLQKDPALLKSFQADPVKALEKVTGMDLPDDQLKPLVAGIKAKLAVSDIGGALDGLKKLF